MKFTTVSPQTKLAFETKMEEVLEICRKKSGKDIPSIPVKFSQMGTRAGVCHNKWKRTGYGKLAHELIQGSSFIVINPDYLVKHWDDMLNDTCPHEVAHYVAVWLYGVQANNHKHLWRMVMSWMGINGADRCHTYDTEGVKLRNTHRDYKYSCGCSTPHMLTPRKHQEHHFSRSAGRRGLQCCKCKQFLVYQGFMNGNIFIPFRKTEPTVPDSQKVMEVSKIITPIATFVHNVNPPSPAAPSFKTVTKFVDGMLVNVRVPAGA